MEVPNGLYVSVNPTIDSCLAVFMTGSSGITGMLL